ncbi:MAG: hypothetical protein K8T25_13675 [Planctomycetia bacterium]|nr:hypothetical protein [Planctomycetia bacterium]
MNTPQSPEPESTFVPTLRALLPTGSEMELAAGAPRKEMRAALAAFDLADAVAPRRVVDRDMAEACKAGLWLAHNYLDESHRISQKIDTPTGSFWHAIMHRREGDYSNAGYWFRRLGEHPVYSSLALMADQLVRKSAWADHKAVYCLVRGKKWDAVAFVDLVQSIVQGPAAELAPLGRQIAWCEWMMLFRFCYRGAVGDE